MLFVDKMLHNISVLRWDAFENIRFPTTRIADMPSMRIRGIGADAQSIFPFRHSVPFALLTGRANEQVGNSPTFECAGK